MERRIRVGISSCLLGENVRYDGGNRLDPLVCGPLAGRLEFVPFCPEVAIGLGVPRDPIRLVRVQGGVRVRGVADPSRDLTARLERCGREFVARSAGLCGYIFKSRSPSCGPSGVPVWRGDGAPADPDGVGAFAAAIRRAWPGMPVEDEAGLRDPARRDAFLARVVGYARQHR